MGDRSAPKPPLWRRGLWIVGFLVLAAVYQLLASIHSFSARGMPGIGTVVSAAVTDLKSGRFWTGTGHTLEGWALGFAISTAIGIPLGILLGTSTYIRSALQPAIEFLRPVPSVALIPVAILTLGIGLRSKLLLIVFGAYSQILVQTMYGVMHTDPVTRETARAYNLSRHNTFIYVTLPAAMPFIMTGLRIAASTALLLGVTAEIIIGSSGLGQVIEAAQSASNFQSMYALVFLVGILGWVINAVFVWLERRLLPWGPSARGRRN